MAAGFETDDMLIAADAAMKRGDWTESVYLLRRLQTSDAGNGAEIDNALGISLARSGDPTAATDAFQAACRKAPENREFVFNLATAQKAAGFPEDAIVTFRKLLALDPQHRHGWYNLGNTCLQLGRPRDAIAAYDKAADLQPDWPELNRNRAIALREDGQFEAALAAARSGLSDNPDDRALIRVVAGALDRLGQSMEAAATLAPGSEIADYDLLAEISLNAGLTDQALAVLKRGYDRTGDAAWGIKHMQAHPPVSSGLPEIRDLRRHFEASLAALRHAGGRIEEPLSAGLTPAFYPGYHGEDEGQRQRSLSDLYRTLSPVLNYRLAHVDARPERPEKLKVCWVSRHLVAHTIGQLHRGFIAGLDRSRFEVHVVGFSQPKDDLAQEIAGAADQYHNAPLDIAGARDLIETLRPDIIVYPDIGMEPLTYFLAHARLAPVQCTAWGHPLTTGIDSIDYFISCSRFEPEMPDGHYSEKLICLSGPATVYRKPHIQRRYSASELGLDSERNSYFCGQSLFKMQPDFDDLLAGILRADPKGEILLIEGSHPAWGQLLRRRFAAHIPDVASRIRFLPRLGYDAFLCLSEQADVLLDTTQWSGGNTALEAIALGQPMVMLPGRFMRGRISAGMYEVCGVTDTICDGPADYVEIAVRLASDAAWRGEIQAAVRKGADRLFEATECLRELERFFDDAYISAS